MFMFLLPSPVSCILGSTHLVPDNAYRKPRFFSPLNVSKFIFICLLSNAILISFISLLNIQFMEKSVLNYLRKPRLFFGEFF